MNLRKDVKQTVEVTNEDVVQDSDLDMLATTTKERISAYFTIAAAAFGLISDGYQNNLMTMTNVVFKRLYPKDYTASVSTRVSNALLVGAIIGQLFVGLICDRMGRKVALVFTTLLIVLGATLGTAARGYHDSAKGLFWFLTFARGITGIGVGGEYPASSTSASEAANEQMLSRRGPGRLLFGGPLASSVFLIVLSIAGESHLHTVWRVCFGVGILFHSPMLSSKLYRKGAIKKRVPYYLVLKCYWRSLIGTCGAWFLYDFVTFPNGVFSGTIISSVIHDNDIKKTAEWQLLLSSIALPGVFIGALLCNPLGRRNTMILGFSGYLIFGLIIGLAYERITKIIPLFVVLTSGTCYGLSAAVGKAGAAIGTQVFTPIQNNLGKRWTFIIAAICGVAGITVTYFFVPDKTGVDLAEEDARFMEYLERNGWEGTVGEDEPEDITR
ncbi:MFS general substrate transporter [Russula aff. rugulosa BPL654]|nr:MFS general substrate transporter [Russula aff. rugulosa BPL654]